MGIGLGGPELADRGQSLGSAPMGVSRARLLCSMVRCEVDPATGCARLGLEPGRGDSCLDGRTVSFWEKFWEPCRLPGVCVSLRGPGGQMQAAKSYWTPSLLILTNEVLVLFAFSSFVGRGSQAFSLFRPSVMTS